ncbi:MULTISPECIES: NUDIX hydrolase [unclassified Novosphingobium]|uniref:NUDIX domain-containing protein n=1 Tax=unclassified Novosphingobium TaxID=2644732 RepID=UPI0025E4644B|nr:MULTISPECIES: NUDIX hydrolase [unclassified Novosphingobium]HQV04697.1 NUDIX hydrolase [Novosphingobium sp.]
MNDPQPRLQSASLIVLHRSSPKLLCVLHPTFRKWMFPGGKVEAGESPHDAVLREIAEEVGLSIVLSDLSDLPLWEHEGNVRLPQPLAIIQETTSNGCAMYVDFVFVGVSRETTPRLKSEVMEANWFDYAALTRLDTAFPIKQMAAEVFERIDVIRASTLPNSSRYV